MNGSLTPFITEASILSTIVKIREYSNNIDEICSNIRNLEEQIKNLTKQISFDSNSKDLLMNTVKLKREEIDKLEKILFNKRENNINKILSINSGNIIELKPEDYQRHNEIIKEEMDKTKKQISGYEILENQIDDLNNDTLELEKVLDSIEEKRNEIFTRKENVNKIISQPITPIEYEPISIFEPNQASIESDIEAINVDILVSRLDLEIKLLKNKESRQEILFKQKMFNHILKIPKASNDSYTFVDDEKKYDVYYKRLNKIRKGRQRISNIHKRLERYESRIREEKESIKCMLKMKEKKILKLQHRCSFIDRQNSLINSTNSNVNYLKEKFADIEQIKSTCFRKKQLMMLRKGKVEDMKRQNSEILSKVNELRRRMNKSSSNILNIKTNVKSLKQYVIDEEVVLKAKESEVQKLYESINELYIKGSTN